MWPREDDEDSQLSSHFFLSGFRKKEEAFSGDEADDLFLLRFLKEAPNNHEPLASLRKTKEAWLQESAAKTGAPLKPSREVHQASR